MKPSHTKIRAKLKARMNREPTEAEVINSESDPIIMGEIAAEEYEAMADALATEGSPIPTRIKALETTLSQLEARANALEKRISDHEKKPPGTAHGGV